MFLLTPIPPPTTSAPVTLELESVVDVMFTASIVTPPRIVPTVIVVMFALLIRADAEVIPVLAFIVPVEMFEESAFEAVKDVIFA